MFSHILTIHSLPRNGVKMRFKQPKLIVIVLASFFLKSKWLRCFLPPYFWEAFSSLCCLLLTVFKEMSNYKVHFLVLSNSERPNWDIKLNFLTNVYFCDSFIKIEFYLFVYEFKSLDLIQTLQWHQKVKISSVFFKSSGFLLAFFSIVPLKLERSSRAGEILHVHPFSCTFASA